MARDRAQQRVLQYQQTLVSIAGQRDSKRDVLSAEVRTNMIECKSVDFFMNEITLWIA